MAVIIIIAIVIFLYWGLVPAKPKTLDDMINQDQRRDGKFSNVYIDYDFNQTFGKTYYSALKPKDPRDKKVFSGTENECENYIYYKRYRH